MKRFLLIALLFASFNAQALSINAKAYLLKDLNTGKVILSKSENSYLPPASTTKLMTLYLVFEEIKKGKLSLTERLTVSNTAYRKGGSKMFLEPGSKIRVVDLIKGIAVSSGNDASIVVAEKIAGSEKAFVKLMNKKAKEFGMNKTNFVNATGWDNKGHLSTAKDLSILAERVIKDYPEYYRIFSLKSFKHNNIRQYNKNTLLGKYGVDGLKTGHVNSIGYNIVSSAKKGDSRYLVVVLGAKSKKARETEAAKLYKFAYEKYKSINIVKQGQIIDQTKVFLGDVKYVDVVAKNDLDLSLTNNEFATLKANYTFYPVKNAPVYYGDKIGTLEVTYEGLTRPIRVDLIASTASNKVGFIDQLKQKIDYKFNNKDYIR